MCVRGYGATHARFMMSTMANNKNYIKAALESDSQKFLSSSSCPKSGLYRSRKCQVQQRHTTLKLKESQ